MTRRSIYVVVCRSGRPHSRHCWSSIGDHLEAFAFARRASAVQQAASLDGLDLRCGPHGVAAFACPEARA